MAFMARLTMPAFRRIPLSLQVVAERTLQRPAFTRLAALLGALALTLLAAGFSMSELSHWDELSASLSWRMADQEAAERRVVVVDIDERSLQTVGPWPWPARAPGRAAGDAGRGGCWNENPRYSVRRPD
jgi:hypothetical protein